MFNLEKLSSTLQQGVSALQDLGAQVANASQVYIEPLQERVQKVRIASFKKRRYPTIDRDIAYLEEMARQRYNCPAPGKRPSGRRPSGRRPSGSPPPPPPAVRGKSFDVSTRGVLTGGGGGDVLAVPEEVPRRYSSPANPGSSIGEASNGNGAGGTSGTSGPSTRNGSSGVPSANSGSPAVAPLPNPGPIKGKNGKPVRQPPVITINRTSINWNGAPTTSATTTTTTGPPRSRVWRGRVRGWWQRFQRYVRAYLDEDEEETGPGNDNRARKDGSDGPPKWVY